MPEALIPYGTNQFLSSTGRFLDLIGAAVVIIPILDAVLIEVVVFSFVVSTTFFQRQPRD